VIERYLAELERALPRFLWRGARILEEVEDHLRASAARVGEEEAVRRFGRPHELARAFRRSQAALIAAAAVLAVLALPVLGYPLLENTLPPAPWPEERQPHHLHWKQDRAAQLFLAAAVAGIAGTALVTRRRTAALVLLAFAVLALVGMGAIGTVLSAQWAEAVPGTPWWHTALGAVFLACAASAAALLARAALLPSRA
jgi:hypothetical protein